MFDEWRERRSLLRELAQLRKEEAALEQANDIEKLTHVHLKIAPRQKRLAAINTDRLIRKVCQLGIELPKGKDSWWWDDLDYEGPDNYRNYLTDTGQAYVSKLIRDERKKNIEWWVKTITPLLGALISLLGLIVALISVSKK
jgi:hypothetical protein